MVKLPEITERPPVDYGAASGNLCIDAGERVHHAIKHDGYAPADVVGCQAGPCLGTLGIHGHVHLRLTAHVVVCYTCIGNHSSVKGSLAVTGIDLDGDKLIIVAAGIFGSRLDCPHRNEVSGQCRLAGSAAFT